MTAPRACAEFELLVSLHATNALRGEERARTEAHLAACASCRAELDATLEVLGLARLPLPSPEEHLLFSQLPDRALEAVQQRERRRGLMRRIGVAMAAAAALSLLPLVPFMREVRHRDDAALPSGQYALAPSHREEVGPDRSWVERLPAVVRSGRSIVAGTPGASPRDAARAEEAAAIEPPERAVIEEASPVEEPATLASASSVPVKAASWEEPDPDALWQDSSELGSLAAVEETYAAADAALQ